MDSVLAGFGVSARARFPEAGLQRLAQYTHALSSASHDRLQLWIRIAPELQEALVLDQRLCFPSLRVIDLNFAKMRGCHEDNVVAEIITDRAVPQKHNNNTPEQKQQHTAQKKHEAIAV